jgi:hypothetical protein
MSDIWISIKSLLAAPSFTSWLQAFAAIVAIGISVLSLLRGSAADRRRERLQRQGIAVAIYPELLKLQVLIQNTREALAKLKVNPDHLVGQSIAADLLNSSTLTLPSMLERNIDKLFMLGVPGVVCLQLVNIIWQHNVLANDIAARVAIMNAQQWPEAIAHLEQHLHLLDTIVGKCAHEVKPLHDSVKG